jgi:hypothetical protein
MAHNANPKPELAARKDEAEAYYQSEEEQADRWWTHPGHAEAEAYAREAGISEAAALRETFSKWLYIPDVDKDMIDVSLAVYKSNEMPGDPLWGIIIDASGGGKTEILRSLQIRKDTKFLSKLTPNSLLKNSS